MLQIPFIRENRDLVIERMTKRGLEIAPQLDQIIALDNERKTNQQELDGLLAKCNVISGEIGELFKSGKGSEAQGKKEEVKSINGDIKVLRDKQNDLVEQIRQALFKVPNVPNELVPNGKTDQDNREISAEGTRPDLSASKLPHWELADKYDLIDFEMGVKITGAGFPVYNGKGAKLQRALINFFLDEAAKAGYAERQVPHLVNEASGIGTGSLPDKEGQMYHVGADDLYLIPTGEIPITNIYRDVILKKEDFPVKMCGYTPCFRREAGSYGKDVRGLNRLHQFDKVEIVQIQHPDKSYDTLEEMMEYVKTLLRKLGLEFRVLRLCGGDLTFASAMTYDFEVFSAAQEKWLEVSSVSNFETFQSNRLKCRFKNDAGKTELAHTLNGSALALPRIVASILENHQTADGVVIPEALRPYTGFDIID